MNEKLDASSSLSWKEKLNVLPSWFGMLSKAKTVEIWSQCMNKWWISNRFLPLLLHIFPPGRSLLQTNSAMRRFCSRDFRCLPPGNNNNRTQLLLLYTAEESSFTFCARVLLAGSRIPTIKTQITKTSISPPFKFHFLHLMSSGDSQICFRSPSTPERSCLSLSVCHLVLSR